MEIIKNIDNDEYKIMCFSDIHGNYEALKVLIDEIKTINPYKVIFLGDAVSMGPDGDKCIDLIRESSIAYLEGNHEFYQTNGFVGYNKKKEDSNHLEWVHSCLSDKQLEYLKTLPNKYIINFKNKNVQFAHFLFNDKEKFLDLPYLSKNGINDNVVMYNNYDYVFYGHNHTASVQIVSNKNYIDVGSSGCTKGELTHYNLIEYKNDEITVTKHNIKYDREAFEERLRNTSYPKHEHFKEFIFGLK